MIAVRHNGTITLAADSQWSTDYWASSQRVQPKIQRRGDLLLTVGPSSGVEAVMWDEICGLAALHEGWPERWATHVFSAAENTITRRMAVELKDTVVLVVWRGRMFKVHGDGGIFEPADGIVAAGCGFDYARAAAHIFRQSLKSSRAVAIKAALVACELSAGCSPPIICETVPA